MADTSITNRGYGVKKSDITLRELESIKKDLTVTPFICSDFAQPTPFKIYQESESKIYMPKAYGLKKFGIPQTQKIPDGDPINIKFTGQLRPEQEAPANLFIDACNDPLRRGGILNLYCGFGKCLGVDTPILMYDGSIKLVQDIVPGDELMGPDSTSRKVLTLARGSEMMYKITQKNGMSYTVNKSHILTLYYQDNLIDISLEDYLALSNKKDYFGFKAQVDFPERLTTTSPYAYGFTCDFFISPEFKYTTAAKRAQLLAGIIDKHGNFYQLGFHIESKYQRFLEDIAFIAKSLGIAACVSDSMVTLYGQELGDIPCKIKQHKITSLTSTKIMAISVKELHEDNYYGFTISGDGRFLLGDFTVTHNTALSIYLTCELAVKTLVIVHKDFLLEQWKERITQFAPSARIGMIKGKTFDIADKDIVIGMLQSLCMKDYSQDAFKSFGMVIVDECFPYDQHVLTFNGPIAIGELYDRWIQDKYIPPIASYNQHTQEVEFNTLTYAWKKEAEYLLKITCNHTTIECTSNHKILTPDGMVEAHRLKPGDYVVSSGKVPEIVREIITLVTDEDVPVYDIEVSPNHTMVLVNVGCINGIVASNCHHTSAEVFSRALKKTNFKYSMGLSATIKRKDGLSKVFMWHLGDVVYSLKKRTDTVQVQVKNYFDSDSNYCKEWVMFNNKLNVSRMINSIASFEPRIQFIINTIEKTLEEEPERKILLLSDRRQLLQDLQNILNKKSISNGQYVGGMKQEALKQSETKQIILGTFHISQEALDIPGLDTLILATPKSDIIQSVGRILRVKPQDRKYVPLVIDIVDNFSIFAKQAQKRLKYYKSCKYDICAEADPPDPEFNGPSFIEE